MKYKQKDGYILRDIAGELMLFPTGSNIQEFQGVIVLNELAAFLWNRMNNYVSTEKLVNDVLNEYDIDAAQAINDLEQLINTFIQYDVIQNDDL